VPDKSGAATLVIRAVDSEALSVDDTLVVTVASVNDPPWVAVAIPDTTVDGLGVRIDSYRDLNRVFADVEDGGALRFAIEGNDNPALVRAVVDPSDSTLDLNFEVDQSGAATIVIRATDSGALSVDDTLTVGVEATTDLPTQFALHQNAPNPFNPTTKIFADIARAGRVDLRIYDVSGRLVRTLVAKKLPRDRYEFEWDGRDDRGRPVGTGVYFYKLVTSDFEATKKMVLLK
jgi:hypothetical protein